MTAKYLTEALDALEAVVRANVRNLGKTANDNPSRFIHEYVGHGQPLTPEWVEAKRVLQAHGRID